MYRYDPNPRDREWNINTVKVKNVVKYEEKEE